MPRIATAALSAPAGDVTNRLAVASDAALFSHDGAGHQVKINKATAADTASVLFQSGWTGHAEMGLAGDSDFAIKTSADGITWVEALKFDAASGTATGNAVQQSATDTTAGRLMRADYGYGPGNLLGAVSEASGTPTGAVIERGSNTDGEYVLFADGTQICWITADMVYDSSRRLIYDWDFPLAFAATGLPNMTANLLNEFGSSVDPWNLFGPFARQGTNPSATGCSVRIYRGDGGGVFISGDMLPVQVIAVGRWF